MWPTTWSLKDSTAQGVISEDVIRRLQVMEFLDCKDSKQLEVDAKWIASPSALSIVSDTVNIYICGVGWVACSRLHSKYDEVSVLSFVHFTFSLYTLLLHVCTMYTCSCYSFQQVFRDIRFNNCSAPGAKISPWTWSFNKFIFLYC